MNPPSAPPKGGFTMSNVADSMRVEAQVKRLWRWVGELATENRQMKKQIALLQDEIKALREASQ